MEHFGIRYEEDLTHICSDYIIESVDLLNAHLSHHGMNFFFDMADVDQQVIGGKHCWDMFGWVVPTESIDEFEHIWLASEDDALEKYDYVSRTGKTETASRTRSSTASSPRRPTNEARFLRRLAWHRMISR